jgi:hypothetical protein
MRSPPIWLSLVGISAGVALALALGISPWSLVIVAAVLACPIALDYGMRGMGRSQDSTPEPPRRLQRGPEARGTLAERDGQQPRLSQEEHTPRRKGARARTPTSSPAAVVCGRSPGRGRAH